MEDISIQEIPRDTSEDFSVTFRIVVKVPKDLLNTPILEALGSSCLLSGFLAEVNEKSMKNFHHMALSKNIFSRFNFELMLQ